VYFWQEVFVRRDALAKGKKILLAQVKTPAAYAALFMKTMGYIAALEAIVLGYFHREVFTACFIIAALWPFCYGVKFIQQYKGTLAVWLLTCGAMSTFTLLPVVKVEDERLILLGGTLMVAVGFAYMAFGNALVDPSYKSVALDKQDWVSKAIFGIQVGLIALSMIVTQSSVRSIQAKQGLAFGNQAVGWSILVLSLTVPFLHGLLRPHTHFVHRLMVVFLTFSPIFVILTISYEGLFYVAFCVTLVVWVRIENLIFKSIHYPTPHITKTDTPEQTSANGTAALEPPKEVRVYRPLNLADTRTALFFFFLIQIAFFGTGNIASISSFSLDSVYRLIPIFSPFAMGALLMFKILIPFAVVSVNLGILNKFLGPLAPSSLFMLVIACSDILTLNFFWLVRDEGSWLDIGTSISHYCIGAGLVVFVSALEVVSEAFVGQVRVEEEQRVKVVEDKSRKIPKY